MGKPALLLLNRKARQGRSNISAATDRLRAAGFDLIEEAAAHAGALSDLIRRHRGDVTAVIIGGGDGTLNAAAEGLVETQLPLGVLPLGTANDLARTLGIPTDPLAAAEVIAVGRTRRIDLGRVNGKHFFNAASLGLSVKITRRLSRRSKGRWGMLAYLFAAARVVVGARPFHAEIHSGAETFQVRSVQIAVGNGRYYGGGMTIDEDATIDEGTLRLYSLEVRRWWQLIPLLPALRRGTLRNTSHVRTLSGSEFDVRPLRHVRHISADGEITGKTPAHFEVVPRAIEVFVPG